MANPSILSTIGRSRQRVPGSFTGLPHLSPLSIIAKDTFTDTNGTNLTAHTMNVGGGWTAWAGTMTVQSNAAQCQSGTTDYATEVDRGDVIITCKFTCGAANGNFAPGITFRGMDSTHYLMAYFSGDGAGFLYQRAAGSFNVMGSFTWSADTNQHTATITAFGTIITIQIDSGPIWTYNVGIQAYGKFCGIRGFVATQKDSFDDFQVMAPRVVDTFPGEFHVSYFTDAFTHADTTRLNTFGWTEDVGTWAVQSNQAQQSLTSSPTNGYVVERDMGFSDYGLEVAITTPSSGGFICGLAFRLIDKNNYLECELNTQSAQGGFGVWYTNNTGNYIQVMRVPQTGFAPATSTTYTMRVRCKGNVIIAELVEAGLKMQGTCDMFLTGTRVGLFEARNASPLTNPCSYDNFKVYNL